MINLIKGEKCICMFQYYLLFKLYGEQIKISHISSFNINKNINSVKCKRDLKKVIAQAYKNYQNINYLSIADPLNADLIYLLNLVAFQIYRF